jgi:hypothetical protein
MKDMFVFGSGGSGGSGASLTVKSSETGTATITNQNTGKSYVKIISGGSPAVFTGLKSGIYTVEVANDNGSASDTVTINNEHEINVEFFSATITVTYPAGSHCTASQGTTKLTAPSDSGTWTLTVPAKGSWIIYCTDGTDSASADVEITEDGQNESVELVFVTYIFREGSGAKIDMNTNSKASIDDACISMNHGGSGAAGKAYTAEKFDLTNVNTLWAEGMFTNGSTSNYRTGIFVHSAILGDNAGPHEGKAWAYFEVDGERRTISLDVSNITGLYYIGFHGKSDGQIYNFYYK